MPGKREAIRLRILDSFKLALPQIAGAHFHHLKPAQAAAQVSIDIIPTQIKSVYYFHSIHFVVCAVHARSRLGLGHVTLLQLGLR